MPKQQTNDETNSQTISQAVFENVTIFSETTLDFELPHKHCLNEIIAIYKSSSLVECSIKMDSGEDYSFIFSSGVPTILPFSEPSTRGTITIETPEEIVFSCIMFFVDMSAKTPVLNKNIIIKNPEQSRSIALDFTEVRSEAAGWDKIQKTEVQIRNPNGSLNTISKSTPKFVWRKKVLYCDLPTGYEHAVRIRIKSDKWTEWSDWLKFTPSRKMTL